MPLFAVLMLLALVLYTLAIFGERFAGSLKVWMLTVFEFAFVADLIGTAMMAQRASGMSLHGTLGFLALVIMFVHLLWAFFSFSRSGRARELFHANSWKAWMVWMAAFLSGALLRWGPVQ